MVRSVHGEECGCEEYGVEECGGEECVVKGGGVRSVRREVLE